MSGQESVTHVVANLFYNATGILAGLVAVVVFWLGSDYLSNTLGVNVPLRQLMFGRNLSAMALSCRFACVIAGTYLAATLYGWVSISSR